MLSPDITKTLCWIELVAIQASIAGMEQAMGPVASFPLFSVPSQNGTYIDIMPKF